MKVTSVLFGSSPGESLGDKATLAFWRAVRTFIQGVVAAAGTGAAATQLLDATYWEGLGVSVLGALFTALLSFLQNVAKILPDDPTQTAPGPAPAPTPPVPPNA